MQLGPVRGQSTARDILIGKFTNDEYPDLIELTDSGAYFFKNENGQYWSGTGLIMSGAGSAYNLGKAVDLNGDGLLDLLLHLDNTAVRIFMNSGGGTDSAFSPSNIFYLSRRAASIAYASFSSTVGALFVGSSNAQHYYKALSNQSWGSSQTDYVTSNFAFGDARKVLSADMNNDGYPDFVLFPASAGKPISILLFNSTSGDFSNTYSISRTNSDSIVDAQVLDMTGSSARDILLLTSGGVELWKNDISGGNLQFSLSSELNPNRFPVTGANSIAVGDFTFHGNRDLFISFSGDTSKLYQETGSRTSTYENVTGTAFTAAQLSNGAIRSYPADLDNDGLLDIVELFPNGKILVHMNRYDQ